MSLFRRLPTSRLLALCIAAIIVAAGAATIAVASGGGAEPPRKGLARAIHAALAAPPVQGITADVTFTNNLITGSSISNAGPLLSGAKGRLWIGGDGQVRLELQSDRGDAQIVSDGRHVTAYDPASNTAYQITLPASGADKAHKHAHHGPPTLADIRRSIGQLARHADLTGPVPDNVAGQPAYTVRISPKHDGGLVGAAALAWDAARGVPLRVAIYAQGSTDPVLELKADDISYGPVSASTFDATAPKGAKVMRVSTPSGSGRADRGHRHGRDVSGLRAVQGRVAFRLAAPGKLVGLPRHGVSLLDAHGTPGALVSYGRGLGGMLVLEQRSQTGDLPAKSSGDHHGDGQRFNLPTVSVDGATGVELATPLGTGLRFRRGGVTYTVLGSVPPAAAEAAARALAR